MHPVLLKLGPLTLYAFGVLLALAFLAGTWLLQRTIARVQRLGAPLTMSAAHVTDLIFWILLSAVLGARLLYVAANWELYRQAPFEMFAVWHGGLIFYGGLAAAIPTAWWLLRRWRLPIGLALDCFTPALAVGHAIGRIGCFLNGCCYGKPTEAWWGVTFLWSEARRHPTQLIESAFLLMLSLVFAIWLLRGRPWRRPPCGRVALTYVLVYAAWRFGIEFLRADNPVLAAGLNLPQWLSLILLGACSMWLALIRRRAFRGG